VRKSTVLKNDFRRRHYSVLIILALILIALAVFLLIWSVIAQIEVIELRYAEMQAMLAEWEYFIASLENKWLLILVLFLLYSLKCFVSVIPLSALFIISGMVFNVQYATAINIIGVAILVSIKFLWGDKFGGGSVSRVISRSGFVKDFLKLEGSGNPWMLFLARLVPFAPVNTVSRLYGASEIQYDKYLLLSLLGFAPRILSFSVLGNNVFDPFSVGFFGPIIIMLFLSGISILILDFALGLFGKRRRLSEIDKEERNNVI
jgi:uncharacterized membrane protein YdjX (TVP38/TMEM64 family)